MNGKIQTNLANRHMQSKRCPLSGKLCSPDCLSYYPGSLVMASYAHRASAGINWVEIREGNEEDWEALYMPMCLHLMVGYMMDGTPYRTTAKFIEIPDEYHTKETK